MGNGQLKPAYNVQVATDAEYIVGIMTSEKCTDTPTLIPFLKQLKENLGYEYEKIVADAGYESEENYIYLEENGQHLSNQSTMRNRKPENIRMISVVMKICPMIRKQMNFTVLRGNA